jgi:hypothetical protein
MKADGDKNFEHTYHVSPLFQMAAAPPEYARIGARKLQWKVHATLFASTALKSAVTPAKVSEEPISLETCVEMMPT